MSRYNILGFVKTLSKIVCCSTFDAPCKYKLSIQRSNYTFQFPRYTYVHVTRKY